MVQGSDAGRWKALGVPVVIGGDNLPSPVGIGLTDLPNIGGAMGPLAPPVPASLTYCFANGKTIQSICIHLFLFFSRMLSLFDWQLGWQPLKTKVALEFPQKLGKPKIDKLNCVLMWTFGAVSDDMIRRSED